MIVTEMVIGIETRDAKEIATGTVTKIGIATDGTLACHSLVIFPPVIADNHFCFLSQLEAGAGVVGITGNLRTASDAVTCVQFPCPFRPNITSCHFLILSVDDAHRALDLAPLAHGVARLRSVTAVRAVRDPVAALRVAVHATVIANPRKHCLAPSVGR